MIALTLALLATPVVGVPEGEWSSLATFRSPSPTAALRFLELDGEPGEELLHVTADGTVELLTFGDEGFLRLGSPLTLAEPQRCLLTLVDLLHLGRPQLIVLDGAGLRAHALGPEGLGEVISLSRRARLVPRTSVPAFADFVRDVGNDGSPDVVVPTYDAHELWISSAADPANGPVEAGVAPRLRKIATLSVPRTSARTFGATQLSDMLSSQLLLPDLGTEDVNGDGREDLIVSTGDLRAFHLQAEDGTFPGKPDIQIDLELFKDTSPRPDVRPGEIVSDGDTRSDTRRDLDGDGIPDFVIAHRRKVWVFHGTDAGPQFEEPSTVLKVAEDVTGLAVIPVDEDERPDLVLLKVELPGIAELVMGVLGEWDITLRVIGYKNEDGRTFATSPTWKVEHEMRLPPILDVFRNPESFLGRFEDLEASLRSAARGDLNGDGQLDLVLVKADGREAQPWIGVWSGAGEGERETDLAGDAEFRDLLFNSEDTNWDLDRVAATLGSMAGARLETLTGGREPDQRGTTRPVDQQELIDVVAADVNGDGSDELVVLYVDPDAPRAILLEVLRAPR